MTTTGTESVFFLSPKIRVVPILHGSGDLAQEIREFLLTTTVDCLAVPLPSSVKTCVERGIQALPSIGLVILPEAQDDSRQTQSFIPIDPCQPVIMALRVAAGEGIDRAFIDQEVSAYEATTFPLPDTFAVKRVSMAAFFAGIMPFMPYPKPNGQRWNRVTWMAFKLRELELEYRSIVCLCNIEDWAWLRDAYVHNVRYSAPESPPSAPFLCTVEPSQLYFVLCELPFVTGLYELRRMEARSDENITIDGIKELLLETRIRWLAKRSPRASQEEHWVTPQLLRVYLQYVRNLSLLENRLTPDLYTMVLAGKQLAGDEFAITLLETAKTYRFQDQDDWDGRLPRYRAGVDLLASPEGDIMVSKNRLQRGSIIWRALSLKSPPSRPQKRKWAYRWDPVGQCSWPPEDMRIERFATNIRDHARNLLSKELAKIEKFTTSFRDGIDVRETLRHWNPQQEQKIRDIYVKDMPASRGFVEIVVFLFEIPADPQKFSWRSTWYAEHKHESTLSFFATPFSVNMVGPGIGQSLYGGAFFLFPPRFIPDIWEDSRLDFANTLETRLIAGAAAYTRRPQIAVVSPVPLQNQWREIARNFQRRLIPIPLSQFSAQTVSRLRRFHVLNGHDIRDYASRFIHE